MERWHAAKPKSIANGAPAPVPAARPAPARRSTRRSSARRWSEVRRDRRVVGITAAMNSGTGLNILQKAEPEHYFDVGIAEQQARPVRRRPRARGRQARLRDLLDLPAARLRPDRPRRLPAEPQRRLRDGPRRARRRRRPDAPRRVRHPLPALPAEHRADGAARRGHARAHAAHGAAHDGPVALRYPRGEAVGVGSRPPSGPIEIGTGEILRHGSRVALLGYGTGVGKALEAADIGRGGAGGLPWPTLASPSRWTSS